MTAYELLKKHWYKKHNSPMPDPQRHVLDAIDDALSMPLESTRVKLGREVYPFEALNVNDYFYGREYTRANNASIYGSIYNYVVKNPEKKFKTVKEDYKGKSFIKVIRIE